ncbi:hypothetical protein [Clostridium tagluense]|uniref:Uncharacterized protein n=1 Tax=Clostridium tagluense TaxID=360422 RepID=A0A401UTN6_9CLOT|nr:hypothetical protein [Clostridium tagluense]GCD12919.1 hypothetical protein Ctaglu_45420 [Clostridium tagluense]
MKDKIKNTKIKMLKSEMKQIINSLNSWIKYDIERFKGNPIEVKNLVGRIEKTYIKQDIEEYILSFNFDTYIMICNIVAEQCLQHGENKIIGKEICLTIETITREIYGLRPMDLCYPTNRWDKYNFKIED